MNTIHHKGNEYTVPGEWNELTGTQLVQVMKVFHMPMEETKGQLLLFRILMNMAWWKFLAIKSPGLITAASVAVDFLTGNNTLTKNVLPVYDGFCGPSDNMRNLKMAEFCFTESFCMAYKQSKDPLMLDKLVATLYRPRKKKYDVKKNPDGDLREPFNDNLMEYYSVQIGDWPIEVKLAILQFYEGCRNEKIKRNPKVFEGGGGEESLYGMWSVMRNVAKAGHFGDFDKVGEQYVDTVLMELNEVVVEAEKMEDEMRKNRTT